MRAVKAELVDHLVRAGFPESVSRQYVLLLDATLASYQRSRSIPTGTAYTDALAGHLSELRQLRDDALAQESTHAAALRDEYRRLEEAIGKGRGEMVEQVAALEQTLRLDINLERQRMGEAYREMERKVGEAALRGKGVLEGVEEQMEREKTKIKYGLYAFGMVALPIILSYALG